MCSETNNNLVSTHLSPFGSTFCTTPQNEFNLIFICGKFCCVRLPFTKFDCINIKIKCAQKLLPQVTNGTCLFFLGIRNEK